ncbi:unnamed protein product [Staurois parvus]|uniref:Uncharacterized protein n=1 Tax=Staurois parvus TaxID=386267 RepID=A0ABN9DDX0_9NEOB|nr:unnamed protein product [Staurois parvus]
MLVMLTVEVVNPLHCTKTQFDPLFSDPPFLPVPPSYLLIRHIVWSKSAHAQFGVYCQRGFFGFVFLGRVHVISTGPINTVQTEVRGPASSCSRMKTPPTSFNRYFAGHCSDEKRYLAVCIY